MSVQKGKGVIKRETLFAQKFISDALENNKVFDTWLMYREIVPKNVIGQRAIERYVRIHELAIELMKKSYQHMVITDHDGMTLLKDIIRIVHEYELDGSVAVGYYPDRILYCSNKKTAAVLALHF